MRAFFVQDADFGDIMVNKTDMPLAQWSLPFIGRSTLANGI